MADLEGSLLGFVSMMLEAPSSPSYGVGGAEIARLYILGPARRLRLGRRLLAAAEAAAVDRGLDHLWLHVMELADWARRAYAGWGFEARGRSVFTGGVAAGMGEMILMTKRLDQVMPCDSG